MIGAKGLGGSGFAAARAKVLAWKGPPDPDDMSYAMDIA